MIDLALLIDRCVNPLHKVTMEAIIKVESSGNPLALGLNKGYKLQTQPKTEDQAKLWAEYLEKNDYNFDVGLGQVNIKNIHKYGYKASDLLDPCLNLKIASDILDKSYQVASTKNSSAIAIQKAISAYNTGNFTSGFANGYVQKVNSNLKLKLANNDIPPIITVRNTKVTAERTSPRQSEPATASANPYVSKSILYVAPPRKASTQEIADATYVTKQ